MLAPAFGHPDLHDVLLEREEAELERAGRCLGGQSGTAQCGRHPRRLDVTAGQRPGRDGLDAGLACGALEGLLTGRGRVALRDRGPAFEQRLERAPAEPRRDGQTDLPARQMQAQDRDGRARQPAARPMHDRRMYVAKEQHYAGSINKPRDKEHTYV